MVRTLDDGRRDYQHIDEDWDHERGNNRLGNECRLVPDKRRARDPGRGRKVSVARSQVGCLVVNDSAQQRRERRAAGGLSEAGREKLTAG